MCSTSIWIHYAKSSNAKKSCSDHVSYPSTLRSCFGHVSYSSIFVVMYHILAQCEKILDTDHFLDTDASYSILYLIHILDTETQCI
jgi:hypothetical protein